MIRRISNKNDYIDIVRSCPSGVIDDIYEVEYYVDGYSSVYSASFSKKGSLLEVIIPSSALQTLPSGLLMRRAKYRNEDPSFPDGNYDLEFVEDMNVWLESGSVEPGPGPEPGEYLTADDLKTINNQSLVGEGNIQIDPGVPAQTFTDHVIWNAQEFAALDSRVTALEQSPGGVSQEQFDAHAAQNDANFSGIDQSLGNLSQGVQQAQATAASAASQAVQAHQRAEQAIQANAEQDDRITNDEVHIKAVEDITDTLSDAVDGLDQRVTGLENAGFATQQDLDAVAQHIQDVDNKAGDIQNQVDGLDQRVTDLEQGGGGGGGTWGSITGDIADQQDLMDEFNQDRGRLDDLENGTVVPTGTATESWVQQQGYITTSDLSGYATETWVQNQDYASDTDLDALDARVSVLEHGGSPVTLSWGGISGTITDQTDLVSYVDQAIEDAISGSGVPLPENVVEYEDTTSGWMSVLSDYDDDCDILKRPVDDEYTGGGVHEANTKNLVLGYHRTYDEHSTEQDITLIEVGRNGNGNMTLYKHVIIDGYEEDNNGHQLIPYVTSDELSDYVSRSYLSNTLSGYATKSYVSTAISTSLSGYATESWVENSATIAASNVTCNITGDVFDISDVDSGLTQIVSHVEDLMNDVTSLDNRVTDLENAGYTTASDVSTAISTALSGYTTTSDVSTAISTALSGYATQQWVQNSYGTRNWTSTNFVAKSEVWTGTESEWNQLTAEEKASYTIALITQ
jgi:uncharacterized protein YukE